MGQTRSRVEPGPARPARGIRRGCALLALAGGLAIGLALAYDAELRTLLTGEWPAPAMALLRTGTWLGYGLFDVAVFAVPAGLAWRRRDRAAARWSLGAAGGVAAAGVLVQVVKNLACRARPTAPDPGVFFAAFPCFPAGYAVASFPSGHATTAFAAAVLLSLRYPRGAAVFFGLAVLVGLSRVVLGSHFPSDVVAGAVLGSVTALAAHAMLRGLRRAEGA
jgi:undecaprenyl-diphosphatase